MTGLLLSVAGPDEAKAALAVGVDILDMKDPAAGALGRLPYETVRAIVDLANGAVVTSATVGDLPMEEALLAETVAAMAATGVDLVKIGFFGHVRHAHCARAAAAARGGARLIAVMMADDAPDFALIPTLAAAGFSGVMLDTSKNKREKNLLDHQDIEVLAQFCRLARQHGLLVGLAGSLRAGHIAPLAALGPDYLGFRGAACRQTDRLAGLDVSRLTALKQLLHKCNKPLQMAAEA